MDTIGLLNRIIKAVEAIAKGRAGLATKGSAEEGLAHYQDGLVEAMAVFKEAVESGDPQTMILVDDAFVAQERVCGDPHDAAANGSLAAAAVGHDEALRVLPTVRDAVLYRAVETSYPQDTHYRYKGMPKDAFHVACMGHHARLGNTLRTPGLNMLEKAVYQQRQTNISAVQDVYFELQQTALAEKIRQK
jgi:hypothetical protein